MITRHSLAGILSLAAICVLALAAACGDDDETRSTPGPTLSGANGGGGSPADEPGVLEVSMGDNFFDPAEFRIDGGGTATFALTNDGAAIHNMRIAGADRQYNSEDDAVSDPPLVNGGEAATLEWFAPSIGGLFAFRCDFHPETMVGMLTVEPTGEGSGAGTEGP
ncbi:MAG: plastocyanin/azurin family copper-binding protein [Dehalococcoidia bacterium]